MTDDLHGQLVYENMLLSRLFLQGAKPHGREALIDRSAAVLLARLEAQGPMSVAELADAFSLDVSTIHRQLAAAMKNGLIDRVPGTDGRARLHRPTKHGSRLFHEEMAARATSAARVTDDWSDEDLADFIRLMRRFNEGVETLRERPWPRPTL
ncbi:MarR family winged helix-turn-helix transcriptional regulator [uncultured Corynebacterium sp.]|uniref:MarR family winged helix-turn-helix transcriptional regulator n=1 Tax=uncultured Corynebacterium sp. TaxID=159447 RepID=UPI0025DA257C|nr:MarR family winged helix-turn-helix transcriptional regulator [uncultured Corynebacterium sp.]